MDYSKKLILPAAGKKAFELFNFIVLILFYSFLAYQCLLAAAAAKASGVAMMAISWKLYPYYYVLAIGILWTAVVTIFQLPLFLPFFKSFFAIITRIAAHRFSPVFDFIENIGFKLSQR